jgi:hypothetical protein
MESKGYLEKDAKTTRFRTILGDQVVSYALPEETLSAEKRRIWQVAERSRIARRVAARLDSIPHGDCYCDFCNYQFSNGWEWSDD